MVHHLKATVSHRSESGELTCESVDIYTDRAKVLALIAQLADFLEAGQLASFTVDVRPSDHSAG